jgi:hypothetical protein
MKFAQQIFPIIFAVCKLSAKHNLSFLRHARNKGTLLVKIDSKKKLLHGYLLLLMHQLYKSFSIKSGLSFTQAELPGGIFGSGEIQPGHGSRDDHQDQDKKNREIREFHSLASRTNNSFALTNAS